MLRLAVTCTVTLVLVKSPKRGKRGKREKDTLVTSRHRVTPRQTLALMRPSTIGNRSSYAPGVSSQANSAANLAKLLEKKKEYEGVAALDKASTAFLERITGLMEDADVMANAGEGVQSRINSMSSRQSH